MQHPGFLETKEEIIDWLEDHKIKRYAIDEETLEIEVFQNVMLIEKLDGYIPVNFRKINGFFSVGGCKLTTLKGCPQEITGGFFAMGNKLKSLEYGPKKVGNMYEVNYNYLRSLEGLPEKITGTFDCSYNKKLTSLVGLPKDFQANLKFTNTAIKTFEGAPEDIGNNNIICDDSQLITLNGMPKCNYISFKNNYIVDATDNLKANSYNCEGNMILVTSEDKNKQSECAIDITTEEKQHEAAKYIVAKFEKDKPKPEYVQRVLDKVKKVNTEFYEVLKSYEIEKHINRVNKADKYKGVIKF